MQFGRGQFDRGIKLRDCERTVVIRSLETTVLNHEMKSECGKGEPVGELCMGGVC